MQDIYAEVYAALVNSSDDTEMPVVTNDVKFGEHPEGVGGTQGNDLVEKVDRIATGIETHITAMTGKFSADKAVQLPTVSVIPMSFAITLPVLGSTNIDFAPYSIIINYWRNLCLMMVYIYFWWATIRVIRTGIS
jgi:hypothetical protein